MKDKSLIFRCEGEEFVDTFSTILDALPPRAAGCEWRILDLYGEGDVGSVLGRTMAALMSEVEAESGASMSWTELHALSKVMTQVFDVLIVGATSFDRNVELRQFEPLARRYEIVIQGFDSSEWRIGGTDRAAIESVATSLSR